VGGGEVFKAASALAGGVARMGETCGALTGAILAVGCVTGRQRLEDLAQYNLAMEDARRVYDRFRAEIGHTICHEIHRLRYGTVYRLALPEERRAFHRDGGHARTGCPEVCGVAARIAAEAILDIRDNGAPERRGP
jgi:C_GCAxxG_C_C family probable redox protein